jgi:hypothetical protein
MTGKGVRCSLLTLVCLAVVLGFSSVAAAANNFKVSGSYSYTDPTICTDPIHVEGSYDEMVHVIFDQSGNAIRLQFTGFVSVTYTNLTTGATYSPNSSGPGTVDLSGQTIIRGANGAIFDSSGILVSTDGRIVEDSNGNIISLSGHVVDVCARLGSTAVPIS